MQTLYVYEDGLMVRKADESIVVTNKSQVLTREPLVNLDGIVIMGGSQITEQALRFAASNNIGIVHADRSGRIQAFTSSFAEKGCTLRMRQYCAYNDPTTRLEIAKSILRAKLLSEQSFLREKRALRLDGKHLFQECLDGLDHCSSINELLGIEGAAHRFYFSILGRISSFTVRSRRPAKDVFNALLNLSYSLLLHHACSALAAKSLDIQLGFLHSYKNGRPSLGLDLIEPLRTLADAFVVKTTNRHEFTTKDFTIDKERGSLWLTKEAFRRFLVRFNASIDLNSEVERRCAEIASLVIAASSTEREGSRAEE